MRKRIIILSVLIVVTIYSLLLAVTITTPMRDWTAFQGIGIGTTNPGVKLEVVGDISTTGQININRTVSGTGSISFNNSDGNDWYIDAYAGRLRFHQMTPDNIERMTIIAGGNVGIGTANPAASAKLEISSTTGALLLPRMTTTQRNALTAVNGMIIYNTTTNKIEGYENGSWVDI